MATKDWKMFKPGQKYTYTAWIRNNPRGQVTVAQYEKGNKFEGLWVVLGQAMQKNTSNTLIKQYKSKAQAMRVAKAYMRKH